MDAVDPALVSQAEAALASVAGIEAVVSTRIRWVGHALWGEMRLMMDCEIELGRSAPDRRGSPPRVLHAVPKLAEVVVRPDLRPSGTTPMRWPRIIEPVWSTVF